MYLPFGEMASAVTAPEKFLLLYSSFLLHVEQETSTSSEIWSESSRDDNGGVATMRLGSDK